MQVLRPQTPKTLVYDGNLKMSFDIDKDMERARPTKPPVPPDAPDREKVPGHVDGAAFWINVEREILRSCFRPVTHAAQLFRPKLHEWAPWTMPSMCANDVNTEEDKDTLRDEYSEAELATITGAELMYFIYQAKTAITANQLGEVASIRGIPLDEEKKRMTRTEIIDAIGAAVMPPGWDGGFDQKGRRQVKTYTKVARASGGVVIGTCPHGTISPFKIIMRGESVRDPADLIRCLPQPPMLAVYDNARTFGSHLKTRLPKEYEHIGALGQPSDLPAAAQGTYKTTLEALRHPSRFGASACFVATDKFHQGNSPNPDDVLFHTKCLTWREQINTQVAEQVNAFLKPCTRYMCNLSPVRFAFVLRMLVNERNHMYVQRRALDKTRSQELGGA